MSRDLGFRKGKGIGGLLGLTGLEELDLPRFGTPFLRVKSLLLPVWFIAFGEIAITKVRNTIAPVVRNLKWVVLSTAPSRPLNRVRVSGVCTEFDSKLSRCYVYLPYKLELSLICRRYQPAMGLGPDPSVLFPGLPRVVRTLYLHHAGPFRHPHVSSPRVPEGVEDSVRDSSISLSSIFLQCEIHLRDMTQPA